MSPGSSKTRGFSLIEVAVYSSILLLLMGGVFMVVEGGMRYFRLASAHETVNQQAVIALSKIRRELANGSQTGLTPGTAPQNHLLFLSPFEVNNTSDVLEYEDALLLYKKWVCFYRNTENRLVMAEFDVDPNDNDAAALTVPDFTADILPLPANTVATNVTAVNFEFFPEPEVIRVTIETEERTGSDRLTSVEMISSIRLVNK